MYVQKVRILEIGTPTVHEYYVSLGVYGGPSNDLYESELYYDVDTYTDVIYGSVPPVIEVA